MSINLDSIKNRLQTLQQQSAEKGTKKSADDIWKPEVGSQQIRIVPYIHDKENPFIELFFHYNVGKRSYLSPVTYGNADPIVEFSEKLKSTGVKEDWVMGKKLEPKMRIYAPVLVRGQEDQGVKFWGFGIQVYQELLSYIADPDYGDITDLINGRDIVVEVRPPADTGKSYPETNIRIKPNQTKVSEDKNVINAIKNQKKITDIFTEYSYDDLKEVLNKWLNPEEETEITSNYEETVASSTKGNTSSTKTQIEDAFAELFNQDN
jgi:hypothetical protein